MQLRVPGMCLVTRFFAPRVLPGATPVLNLFCQTQNGGPRKLRCGSCERHAPALQNVREIGRLSTVERVQLRKKEAYGACARLSLSTLQSMVHVAGYTQRKGVCIMRVTLQHYRLFLVVAILALLVAALFLLAVSPGHQLISLASGLPQIKYGG